MDKIKTVQSVERAIMILKCFSEERYELKLSEIAEELDLNKSTVHGIVATLKYHGLLSQNEENQKYMLGPSLLELGDIAANSIDILKIAPVILKNLSLKIEETIHVGILDRMEIIYIYKHESYQSMRIYTKIGARNPAHCTGLGKALLAYVDDDILIHSVPEKLDRFTKNTITHKIELFKELKLIKEKGYSIDNEEIVEGLVCVAAPVFDNNGNARYAISVSGPKIRMTNEKISESIAYVKEAARELSYKLGYKG